MTKDEFSKLRPGKSILKTLIDGEERNVLFKFFICDKDKFDGYSLVVTCDMDNPYPQEVRPDDFETFFNLCEIVKL